MDKYFLPLLNISAAPPPKKTPKQMNYAHIVTLMDLDLIRFCPIRSCLHVIWQLPLYCEINWFSSTH